MSRIVKKYDERKNEFLDVAERLFKTNGYEETSVNSIVESVGVAKGTFYHYFDTKEEILKAILHRNMMNYVNYIETVCMDKKLNAFEKMQFLMRSMILPRRNDDLEKNIEDNEDSKIHQALENEFLQSFYPIILMILKEGIYDKIFDIRYPEEIAEILLFGIRKYMHRHLPNFNDEDYAKIKLSALEELFEKVLGSKNGRITLTS